MQSQSQPQQLAHNLDKKCALGHSLTHALSLPLPLPPSLSLSLLPVSLCLISLSPLSLSPSLFSLAPPLPPSLYLSLSISLFSLFFSPFFSSSLHLSLSLSFSNCHTLLTKTSKQEVLGIFQTLPLAIPCDFNTRERTPHQPSLCKCKSLRKK